MVPKIGTGVTVVVGVRAKVNVPNVVGRTEAEARAALQGIPNVNFGLVAGTPPGQAGRVQGQSVSGIVDAGTPINVAIWGPVAEQPSRRPHRTAAGDGAGRRPAGRPPRQ